MLNAQDVRMRRINSKKENLTVEIEPVFDWILKLIDQNTKNKIYDPLDLVLYYDESKIRVLYKDARLYDSLTNIKDIDFSYDLSFAIREYGRTSFIKYLAEAINGEDGFGAYISYDDSKDLPASYIKTIYINVIVS